MSRIAANNQRTKHSDEIAFLNALCIDLKKVYVFGSGQHLKHHNIGADRLEEFTRVIDKLAQCKEQSRFLREVKGTWLDSEGNPLPACPSGNKQTVET